MGWQWYRAGGWGIPAFPAPPGALKLYDKMRQLAPDCYVAGLADADHQRACVVARVVTKDHTVLVLEKLDVRAPRLLATDIRRGWRYAVRTGRQHERYQHGQRKQSDCDHQARLPQRRRLHKSA